MHGRDYEGARGKIVAEEAGVVLYRRGELEDNEDDEDDPDADSLPDQYDSYNGMYEEGEEEDDF